MASGNKLTMYAYANRARTTTGRPDTAGAAEQEGPLDPHGMLAGHVDVTDPNARPYRGCRSPSTSWTTTEVRRRVSADHPVRGAVDPVIQVVGEDEEVVYTLRISGSTFRPKVFKQGTYTVHVGEGPTRKTLRGIKALPPDQQQTIIVDF